MTDLSAIAADDPAPVLRDAAMSLLIEHGIVGLDFDLVDTGARLPAGTCRRRYGSRGKLVADLLEAAAVRFHSDLHTIFHRHTDDPVTAVVEWLTLVLGPARNEMRAVWILLLDPGVRSEVNMYADALTAGWEREIASGLGSSLEEVRVVWPIIEGWAGGMLIRDRPMPDREVVAARVRTLLQHSDQDAHAPPGPARPPAPPFTQPAQPPTQPAQPPTPQSQPPTQPAQPPTRHGRVAG